MRTSVFLQLLLLLAGHAMGWFEFLVIFWASTMIMLIVLLGITIVRIWMLNKPPLEKRSHNKPSFSADDQ
jgi:hypothetical protein